VYWGNNPSGMDSYVVQPGGEGVSNTINRAELAGCWQAIKLGAHTIATDSSSSIRQLYKTVMRPQALAGGFHLHWPILSDMLDMLRACTHPVHFIKVKAHSGIAGNELADRAAVRCRTGKPEPDDAHTECDVAPHPFASTYWPAVKPANPTQNAADDTPRYLSDTHKSLRNHMTHRHRLGLANPDLSVHASAWRRQIPSTLGSISNAFFTSSCIPYRIKRTVLKLRAGTVWHAGKDNTSDGTCPICKRHPDGVMHILNHCPHSSLLRTDRHNAVGRIILSALSKGRMGSCLHQADVGCEAKTAQDGIDTTNSTRNTPEWLLPPNSTPTSRPDAILVTNLDTDSPLAGQCIPPHKRQITVIELKVCNDTAPEAQHCRATSQHAALLALMTDPRTGHLTQNVRLAILQLGARGTIYKDTMTTLTDTLHMDKTTATTVLTRAHHTLCKFAHTLVCARRQAETTGGGAYRPRATGTAKRKRDGG
jgi:ribonuclease HI